MNHDELRQILQLARDNDVAELELHQSDGSVLRMKRGVVTVSVAPAVVAQPAAEQAQTAPAGAAPSPAAAPPTPAETGNVLKSPIVGTFYRAPDPNSPAFVNVGDRVRVGQVLCIVEAMKLMNEIEAEQAGTVVKIHPENGQPVQYGDPLFTIKPD